MPDFIPAVGDIDAFYQVAVHEILAVTNREILRQVIDPDEKE